MSGRSKKKLITSSVAFLVLKMQHFKFSKYRLCDTRY